MNSEQNPRSQENKLVHVEQELRESTQKPTTRNRTLIGLYDTPKHNDLIYDIGMHMGEDTEFYLRKGFRVVAFEAHPGLVQFCTNGLKEYIDQDRLTIVEGAIVNPDTIEPGHTKVRFFSNNQVSVWGTACADWAERNKRLGTSSTMIEVGAVDLASVMQRYGIPHYMKIDIEGQDMVCVDVLRLFRERPNYVSIESSKTSFAEIEAEIGGFVDLGYDSFQAIEQSQGPPTQIPPHPAREGAYAAWRFKRESSGLFGSELGGEWKSKREILRQYRFIRLGYYLLGDDGILNQWKFQGAWRLRSMIHRYLRRVTKAPVPGWYDTHARHSSVKTARKVASARAGEQRDSVARPFLFSTKELPRRENPKGRERGVLFGNP